MASYAVIRHHFDSFERVPVLHTLLTVLVETLSFLWADVRVSCVFLWVAPDSCTPIADGALHCARSSGPMCGSVALVGHACLALLHAWTPENETFGGLRLPKIDNIYWHNHFLV